jgi:signal transduction histidine kinase
VLETDGLQPALEQLAARAPVPVALDLSVERYAPTIESTIYFLASEALANVAKYSEATRAEISVQRRNGSLVVCVADDGVGGARPDRGSGLTGLADRVAALEARLAAPPEDLPADRGPAGGQS